ncbi:monovalent cation:proton antiporter-2 (CPA2) family protein [Aestuariibacter sp. AA17]|uniref:Monovalent cation:proton antiporter-2 (CPA2) family protein n=1 Tax=Fluctibacter corallii TaxID=2984329 RepID=A0ABT3A8B7_9ALTE|nr:monovalent cation:proton antiporter-2 (CPA2) family protein [Aestuariibacter sp. AA17]MCV2884855.1 monovalent cation:proton antiporter-2 (CPA2) family protein [Aestuariibacter sp. AA17]
MTEYFLQAFIYLAAAVIAVPLAKRLGLGSVLGYLIAGVIIGPITHLVGEETTTIQHFAEFGVVMMLFLVGLELEPKKLWQMRSRLLGMGGLQVGLSAALLAAIALFFSQPWKAALAIGLIFSLSSTAIVLQTFEEKGLTKTEGGKNAFSVLLMQDIAVIPMLAFIPVLAAPDIAASSVSLKETAAHHNVSLVAGLPAWGYALVIVASVGALVLAGHYLSRPLFRYVASSGLREIFVATALLLVVGIAALMNLVELSPALGTFLAGVVLANSEFRHELESNLAPFKGLLLGLFFITVGAGINMQIFVEQYQLIIGLTVLVMVVKGLVLMGLALMFNIKGADRWLFALSLAQAGEFGFVLLSFSIQNHVFTSEFASVMQMVVALSMFLTPLLFIVFDRVVVPRFRRARQQRDKDTMHDDIHETGEVIIAGIGRFGQIVNRLLTANGMKTVVLDHETAQIDNMRKIDIQSYYGDTTRPELLDTAGIEHAAMVVVAIDNRESINTLVKHIKHAHPTVKVLTRAFDKGHSYELRLLGADYIVAETYHSALELGAKALEMLNIHPFDVEQKRHAFCQIEKEATEELYETWKHGSEGQRFDQNYRKLFIELEGKIKKAMLEDRLDQHNSSERGWTPPPKGYDEDLKNNER